MNTILDPYFEIGTQISITLSIVFFIYGIHLRIPIIFENIKQIFFNENLHRNLQDSVTQYPLNNELYQKKYNSFIIKNNNDIDFVIEMSEMQSSRKFLQSIKANLSDSTQIYHNPIIEDEIISTLKAEGQIFFETLKLNCLKPKHEASKNSFENEGNYKYLPS